MKGGSMTMHILSFLKDMSRTPDEMFPLLFGAGYGASLNKMQRAIFDGSAAFDGYQKSERFKKMLYKLKREGLIKVAGSNKEGLLRITEAGRNKLLKLRMTGLAIERYEKRKGSTVIIVVFDIPERERKKRDWLRSVLMGFDFKMIQKSVWFGKTRLPEDFLNDLNEFNIIKYVEIFEISKSGSLNVVS